LIKKALTRLGKDSLLYGLGGAINRFIGFFLLPFFTEVLSPKDYGISALIALIGVAMCGVLSLGTGNSMGMLYYKEDDLSKRPSIIWTNFILLMVNGIFWYSIVWFCAPNLSVMIFQTSEYGYLIRLAFLSSVLSIIADPWLAYLRMEGKAKQYLFLTLGSIVVNIPLSILFVLTLRWGVMGLLLAGTLGTTIYVLMTWFFVGRKIEFKFDPKYFIPLVRIGFPSIFGVFAFLVIDYADRQMIERMLSLKDLGVYTLGYSFALVIMIVINAFSTAWPPFFMSYIKKQDEARQIFGRVLTYYIIGAGSLVVIFFCFAKPVLLLMANHSFHDAWVIVGFVAAGYALKGSYLILLPGLYFNNKLIIQSGIEWIAAVLNIGLNLWLIPTLGILGAAVSTSLSYLSLPVLAGIAANRYFKVEHEWSRMAFVITSIVVTVTVLYKISQHFYSSLVILTISCVGTTSLYILFTFMILLRKGERNIVYNKIKI
jgi:O-antigen/teichoic acid export membrane protein